MWPNTPLCQLCDILDSRRKPITRKNRSPGAYPYYGATGILDYVEGYLFDEPLVLIGEDGAKWDAGDNSAFSIKGKTWVNNHAHVIRPNRDKVMDKWLTYYLNGEDLSDFITGMTVPKLNQGKLKEIPIPLPPIPEQQRIVAILDQAFADIEKARANAEQNLKNARELFDSYLNQVFSQRGEGWVVYNLEDLCDLISGQHIDAKDYNSEQQGIGYLTGPSDFGELNPIVTKWTEHPKRTAVKGDILITVKGSGVGKINIMDSAELAISRQLMAIRPTRANGQLLYWFLSLQFNYFQSLANGAAIPGISRGDVLGLTLSIPIMGKQINLVAKMDAMYDECSLLNDTYMAKINSLDELKKSLLQKAFSGELTKGEGRAA